MFDQSIPAVLVLADGRVFQGCALGAQGLAVGEVVFNTAMSGYQEILTDPSYAKQLICFTYPHIGNVGVNPDDAESAQCFASGMIIADDAPYASNWRSTDQLQSYCKDRGMVVLGGVDTRALTRHLRENGAQVGAIACGEQAEARALAAATAFPGLKGMDLTAEVTTEKPYTWETRSDAWLPAIHNAETSNKAWHVVVLDYGVKRQMLRLLADRHCRVTVLPAHTSADAIMAYQPDGILLSNGPGDPAAAQSIIATIQALMQEPVPLLGICLGFQLLALASGGVTEKMAYGHHGANHPVFDTQATTVMITSQNHGFHVLESHLSEAWEVTHRSLFDGTIQGLRHRQKNILGFQGHPEASPGPEEGRIVFDAFIDMMQDCRTERQA